MNPDQNKLVQWILAQKGRFQTYFSGISNSWKTLRKEKSAWATAIIFGGTAVGVFLLFLISLTMLTYFGVFGKLPDYAELQSIENNIATEVYSQDGVLLGKYFIENRVNADFEDISPYLIQALVATEDARFFDHDGVDYLSWFRVAFRTVLRGDSGGGGGSTLSQQLAKNLYKREQYRFFSLLISKIREIIIATRLEDIYTKEELLNLYLNTVPFGKDMYGVKVAAQRFFNRSPAALEVEEAAVLVGMLKANQTYNPVDNPDRSLVRRNVVLQQMVQYNYLDALAYDTLSQKPIEVSYFQEGHNQGLATHFREHLRLELAEWLPKQRKPDGSAYNLYTDGLKIFTSIHARLQQYAEEAVHQHISSLQDRFFNHWKGKKSYGSEDLFQTARRKSKRYQALEKSGLKSEKIDSLFQVPVPMTVFDFETGSSRDTTLSPNDSLKYYLSILHAGFLAGDPKSGQILAWVGGHNFRFFKYDHVHAKRQVGSVFKPIVFAQALQKGIPPCDYISNLQVTYTQYENWTPRNSDGQYGGVYSMEGALAKSVNAATVDLMMRTGIDSIRQLAHDLGIDSDLPSVPSIGLGSGEASLWDMTEVYGTFANGGQRPVWHYLERIETADGDTLFLRDHSKVSPPDQVLPDSIANRLTKMLRSVVDSGTARRLRYQFGLKNAIAGKTGTTQGHSDGWFVGYTPEIVAGVWVGAESPQVRFRSMQLGQGSNTALPVWGLFMQKTLRDREFSSWKRSTFPQLDSLSIYEMNCPLYLEDRSLIPGLYDEGGPLDWLDWLFGAEEAEAEPRANAPGYRSSKRSGESEKIRKRNQQLEEKRRRKKRRKAFFDKILKKN